MDGTSADFSCQGNCCPFPHQERDLEVEIAHKFEVKFRVDYTQSIFSPRFWAVERCEFPVDLRLFGRKSMNILFLVNLDSPALG